MHKQAFCLFVNSLCKINEFYTKFLAANFTLPSLEFGWFDDIIYTDLKGDEAKEEVKKYNEKGKKAIDDHPSNRDKRNRRDHYQRDDRRAHYDDRRRSDFRNNWNDRHGGGGGYYQGGGNRWGKSYLYLIQFFSIFLRKCQSKVHLS